MIELPDKVNDDLMFNKEKMADTGRLKGFLEGDDAAYDLRSKSKVLDKWIEEQKAAGTFSPELLDLLMMAGWRLKYRFKPVTPKEFLTPQYIGDQALAIWPPVAKAFEEFLDRKMPYRTLCMYTAIGWGKTLCLDLIKLYIMYLFAYMWQPWKFFGHSPSTRYSMALCSFTEKKASSLLFEPLQAIIEQAPLFEKVKFHDDIVHMNQTAYNDPHIFFTTATKTSVMEFTNGLDIRLIASSGGQVGQTLVTASMTELAWWEENGWSKDEIFTFFTNIKQRVDSRMKGNFLGRTMIDSSPYSYESPIDDWILNTAMHSDKCYVIEGSRWKYYPQEFPECKFDDTGAVLNPDWSTAFPLFKGSSKERPRVIESPNELATFDRADILWAPKKQIGKSENDTIDFKEEAETNAYDFLRNRAGIPAGASDRLFNDPQMIEDVFDNDLPAIYDAITAPSNQDPSNLIWNQISKTFFSIYSQGNFCLKNHESLPRVLAVDQSTTTDATAIALMHVEELNGKICYVVDMLIIIAAKNGIPNNLEAIKDFIIDLVRIGHVPIRYASFDTFQSESTKQSLLRAGIDVCNLSVDSNNSYYANIVNLVYNRLLKCGKNIFVKNNLRSLHLSKRKSGTIKYDHFNGNVVNFSENEDWDSSPLGYNAKDGMDAITACVGLIDKHASEFQPIVQWQPYRKAFNTAAMNDGLKKLGLVV